MRAALRVYVDGRGYDVPAGGTALDAIRAADPALADRVAAGERAITDSRGLPLPPESAAFAGAIYRVIPVRHRSTGTG
ncbi:MAG TPA: hypothetical protein VLE53_10645 [Gemmatimonadaceae bacterium]|nr:hypothetical protein [Gemmatimonadaceae bacterium]